MNKFTVIGIVLILASLWGGSYVMSIVADTWASFPTLATAVLSFLSGICLITAGLAEG